MARVPSNATFSWSSRSSLSLPPLADRVVEMDQNTLETATAAEKSGDKTSNYHAGDVRQETPRRNSLGNQKRARRNSHDRDRWLLDEELSRALGSPDSRAFILKVQGDLKSFVLSMQTKLEYSKSNAYYGLLLGRMADYYGLECKSNPKEAYFELKKTTTTRIPQPLNSFPISETSKVFQMRSANRERFRDPKSLSAKHGSVSNPLGQEQAQQPRVDVDETLVGTRASPSSVNSRCLQLQTPAFNLDIPTQMPSQNAPLFTFRNSSAGSHFQFTVSQEELPNPFMSHLARSDASVNNDATSSRPNKASKQDSALTESIVNKEQKKHAPIVNKDTKPRPSAADDPSSIATTSLTDVLSNFSLGNNHTKNTENGTTWWAKVERQRDHIHAKSETSAQSSSLNERPSLQIDEDKNSEEAKRQEEPRGSNTNKAEAQGQAAQRASTSNDQTKPAGHKAYTNTSPNCGRSSESLFDSQERSSRSLFNNQGRSSGSLFNSQGRSSESLFNSQERSSKSLFNSQGCSSGNLFNSQGRSSGSLFDSQERSSRSLFDSQGRSSGSLFDSQGGSQNPVNLTSGLFARGPTTKVSSVSSKLPNNPVESHFSVPPTPEMGSDPLLSKLRDLSQLLDDLSQSSFISRQQENSCRDCILPSRGATSAQVRSGYLAKLSNLHQSTSSGQQRGSNSSSWAQLSVEETGESGKQSPFTEPIDRSFSVLETQIPDPPASSDTQEFLNSDWGIGNNSLERFGQAPAFTKPKEALEHFFQFSWDFYSENDLKNLTRILEHCEHDYAPNPKLYLILKRLGNLQYYLKLVEHGISDTNLICVSRTQIEDIVRHPAIGFNDDAVSEFSKTFMELRYSVTLHSDKQVYEKKLEEYLIAAVYHPRGNLAKIKPKARDFEQMSQLLRLLDRDQDAQTPKLLYMLHRIGEQVLLPEFQRRKIGDHEFPFHKAALMSIIIDENKRKLFIKNQELVMNKNLMKDVHMNFENEDKFEITCERYLGSGGFGSVDAVRLGGEIYARKKYERSSPQNNQQFVNEVKVLRLIRHYHCVRLVSSYTTLSDLAIITSPVADMNLKHILEDDAKLSDSSTKFLASSFRCLLTALDYLHSIKIVHKDIKPENVLRHGERVLITDFGLSADRQNKDTSIVGKTVQYAALEVSANQSPTYSSDIFSLGCVFLEILARLQTVTQPQLWEYLRKNGSTYQVYCHNRDAIEQWLKEETLVDRSGIEEFRLDSKAECVNLMLLASEPDSRPSAKKLINRLESSALSGSPGSRFRECCTK